MWQTTPYKTIYESAKIYNFKYISQTSYIAYIPFILQSRFLTSDRKITSTFIVYVWFHGYSLGSVQSALLLLQPLVYQR